MLEKFDNDHNKKTEETPALDELLFDAYSLGTIEAYERLGGEKQWRDEQKNIFYLEKLKIPPWTTQKSTQMNSMPLTHILPL